MSDSTMKYASLDLGTIEATFNILGGIEGAARLRRGELVLVEAIKQVKTYLRQIHWFGTKATKGNDTYASAAKVFLSYFDPDFENWGVVFSGVAPATDFWANELILDGKFVDFLGNTAEALEKFRMLGSQFLAICRDKADQLRGEGYANFFVLTKNDEPVAKDLSNVFVASVYVYDRGELIAYLDGFRRDRVWRGGDGHRVFSPRQQ